MISGVTFVSSSQPIKERVVNFASWIEGGNGSGFIAPMFLVMTMARTQRLGRSGDPGDRSKQAGLVALDLNNQRDTGLISNGETLFDTVSHQV
jgi:hypothetical protein